MRPDGHENVATVLVDPAVLRDFELDLMAHDFRVWPVHRVSTFPDPQRLAFQIRRSLIDYSNGRWADAADWTLVWITFGESWLDGDEPIPWPAHAALWDNLPAAKQVQRPQPNELLFGQDHGMVLYRRPLRGGGELAVDGVRDYATVFHGGRYVDYLSRVQHPKLRAGGKVRLPATKGEAPLEILVDSFGHVGYGQATADRKGIVGTVQLDGQPLEGWEAVSLPLDGRWLAALKPLRGRPVRPGVFFRGSLSLAQSGDCYLDMADWAKGYLWVNGHLLGRYWNLGPQQRLYCPASWLRAGDNEVLVFDMHRTEPAPIRSAASLSG